MKTILAPLASLIFLFAPYAMAQNDEKSFLHDQISYPLNVVSDSLSLVSQEEIAQGYYQIVIQFTTAGTNSCERFTGLLYVGVNSYQALSSAAPTEYCLFHLVADQVQQLIPFHMDGDEGLLTINSQAYTLRKDANGLLGIVPGTNR